MKGILQPDKRTIKGPVTMEEPSVSACKCDNCEQYRSHIASLPSIPAIGFEGHQPGEVSYVERYQMTTYSKEDWYYCSFDSFFNTKSGYRRIVATPSPQGEENDVLKWWDKKSDQFKDSTNFIGYSEGFDDGLNAAKPTTHYLTTDQLVAFGEAMIEHGIDISKSLDAAEGTTTPDLKTYLNKLNIDIP